MTLKPLAIATLAAAGLCAGQAFATTAVVPPSLGWSQLWTTGHSIGAEIVDFDSSTQTLWVTSEGGIDVLSLSTGALQTHLDLSAFGAANSVSIFNGLAAVAVAAPTITNPGAVHFFNTTTFAADGVVATGALPDMVTFTADGSRLLVANEGEAKDGVDPMGSVSIIEVATRNAVTPTVATAGFGGVTLPSGVRSTTLADIEPEYIAVAPGGNTAFVALQEANAIATLDLNTNSFTSVAALGTKDFSQSGNAIDPNDRDSTIALRSVAVRGLYQPDAIASYSAGGQTYIVSANEGDARADESDEARASSLGVSGDLARMTISTLDSSASDLVAFGARSFSIWDANGNQVFDSGNQLDAEAIARGIYDDGRSDNKGVEPEGVSLLEVDGRTIAFIGLERTTSSAIAMYDITDPANASFIDMIVGVGDVSPEGLKAFAFGGSLFLAVANEVSSTTTLYALAPVPEPESWAMMLAGLGLLGQVARRRR